MGRAADRERLRREAAESGLEIVGEAATLAGARQIAAAVDGYLVAAAGAIDSEPAAGHDGYEEPLTGRELDVLALLAEGLPNKGIAARLGISDQTVKFHVASLTAKLGAVNRTDAVRRAVRRGLVIL